MKKIIPFFLLFWICITCAWAQEVKERIEAAKVGLITQQLNLTTEQSKLFWPIYNKYTEELQSVRKQVRELKKGFQTKSDEQLKKDLDKVLELKEKEVDVEKKYLQEFLKVINVRQVAMLHRADQLFKAMLIKRLVKPNKNGKDNEEMLDDIDD
jgi:Skp family chaperone for outer membrane proteins